MSKEKAKIYYNKIAKDYHTSRFLNSYGKHIDKQEREFIKKNISTKNTLNLGCGTGRFMEYCTVGIDFSIEMLKIAKVNYPKNDFYLGSADTTPFDNNQFDAIICLHVIMHLTISETEAIFREVNRILKPGGTFIFDYPSLERRKLTKYRATNWHGANAFNKTKIQELIRTQKWITIKRQGVLFIPIHQIPLKLRKPFFLVDQLITKSPFKQYSSYLMHKIKKTD